MNLYEKIQAVGDDIRNIEKGITIGTGNYSYKAVGDLDVTLAVKDAEKKYRITSIPFKQELISSEVVRSIKKDNIEALTYVDTVKMTVRIIDLDDTTQFIDVESFGKGIDSGDKGFGKASTYARKYALLNAYKIATGEDPDANKSEEIKTMTVDDKKNIVIAVLEKDNKKLIAVLSHFNVQEIGDLTKDQFEIIYKQFKTNKTI